MQIFQFLIIPQYVLAGVLVPLPRAVGLHRRGGLGHAASLRGRADEPPRPTEARWITGPCRRVSHRSSGAAPGPAAPSGSGPGAPSSPRERKRLSRLTRRPGIDQRHAFIVTMHRSAVVSLWAGPDCFPGRLRSARPTSAVEGARRRTESTGVPRCPKLWLSGNAHNLGQGWRLGDGPMSSAPRRPAASPA